MVIKLYSSVKNLNEIQIKGGLDYLIAINNRQELLQFIILRHELSI